MSWWASHFDDPSYVLTLLFSLFFVPTLVAIAVRRFRLHRLAINNGCRAGKAYKHLDPYSGIHLLLRVIRDYQNARVLEVWQGFSDQIGKTFRFWVLGNLNFVTSEPKNVEPSWPPHSASLITAQEDVVVLDRC